MRSLNANYITEQEKLAAGGAWIWLIKLIKAGSTTLRYTNNSELTTWRSEKYTAVPMSMDDAEATLQGKFPEYRLVIGEVDLMSTLRTGLVSAGGYVGGTVQLMVIHSDHTGLNTPAIDEHATVLNCEVTAAAVILTLGIPSLLGRRFPRDRYVPAFCRHKYSGALCKYDDNTHSLTSTQIAFVESASGQWSVWVGDGGLIAILTNESTFTVSGSQNNNGIFKADRYYALNDQYIYVDSQFTDASNNLQDITAGSELGNAVTITLGYLACDHTVEACKLRNNLANYGGSPGVAGGIYA